MVLYNEFFEKVTNESDYTGFATEYTKEGYKICEGNFINGKLNGKGIEYSEDYRGIKIFEGYYKDNLPYGTGKQYSYDTGELICEGIWDIFPPNSDHSKVHSSCVNGKL